MATKSKWMAALLARLPAVIAIAVGLPSFVNADPVVVTTSPLESSQARVRSITVERALVPDITELGSTSLAVPEVTVEQDLFEPSGPAKPIVTLPEWPWNTHEFSITEFLRLNVPDTNGMPLIYQAVLLADHEWVSDLLGRGVDPNEFTPGGDTPLLAAIRFSATECVHALLFGGADPTLVGIENQAPVALACLRRGPDIVAALLAAGANPNTRFTTPVLPSLIARVTTKDLRQTLENDRGVTLLMACASRGDVEGATELLKAGAKPGMCTTRFKRYPINFAAVQGYLFLMRIILGRQPESEPEILVTVDLSQQRAWVTKEGVVVDSCAVSTGRDGYSTPAGRYVVTDKHRSWTSTLYHVAMPYFMRLNCGAIGLHSGYVTGRPASHGCIRLPHGKAQKFFAMVRVGDEVQIVH